MRFLAGLGLPKRDYRPAREQNDFQRIGRSFTARWRLAAGFGAASPGAPGNVMRANAIFMLIAIYPVSGGPEQMGGC
jgi:hypothetical protein